MFILYLGGRGNGGRGKNGRGRGRGKSTMANTSITPQANSNETNKIEGGIPTSHNKGREKEKQVIRPILTLPISPTNLTRSRSPDDYDNTKDIDDCNSTSSDDNDDNYVYGEIADDDDNKSFNSASSTSTYTPTKRNIPRITDLLQLTD